MKAGIRAIWRHLQAFRGYVNWLIILGLISAVANGFVPYVTGRFFDALIGVSQHNYQFAYAYIPLWMLFLGFWAVIQIVAGNIDWIKDWLGRRVDTGVRFKLQTDGFVHMFRMPLTYHKNAHSNGDLQKFSSASWRISAIVGQAVDFAPQLLSIVIGLVLAAIINLLLAGVLLVGVAIYTIILIKIVRPIAEVDSEVHRIWNHSWDDAAASVQQIESVKQASAEDYEVGKVERLLVGKTQSMWLKLERNWSNINFFQHIIVFFTQLTVFLLSVNLVANGSITVGQLIALNGYSMMFFGPFASLGRSWQVIQNGITSAAHAEEIFDQKEEIYRPEGAAILDKITGKVSFKDVHFRYGDGQPEVLNGLDLEVHPGEVVALVGESGVGKSTSIHLISGYYFPTEGAVTIDGVDTRKLDLSSLRSQIAVVPQEVALFNDTLMANIRYGSFDATDEQVISVAKEAHMKEFIEALPDKYQTLVGERGIKLSVGQKQRVAIARAMLRNPAILILDEPTSALDAETERIVTGSLEKLMTGRTTFVIAHRLSTVRKANVILVFQKGKVVERGTHDELIKRDGGIYRRLHDYQIGLH